MNIYTKKKRWKWILFGIAVLIVAISLWYTNILVKKIAQDERNNIKVWADAIHRKVDLVNYTDRFFEQLKIEERKRAELLAEAFRNISRETQSDAFNFYLKLISGNTTIPVILTDDEDTITNAVNINFDRDSIKKLSGELKREFSVYAPIKVNYYADKNIYLYYKESKLFTELRNVLDDLIESFFSEVVLNSASVPVIITDSTKTKVIAFGKIDPEKANDSVFIQKTLSEMAFQNKPIDIDIADQGKRYIFYKDSELLTRLRIYPYIQFSVIGLFLLISYILFSSARKSEQNQVWVGLAKETAHQLGTPLSSMIAWIELLKLQGLENETILELKKDVNRLETITERFSKIGSEPKLELYNIVKVIYDSIEYIKSRTSPKVEYIISPSIEQKIFVPINLHLFEWVIENLCKNSVDAIGGNGKINIDILKEGKTVFIDFSDNGKGISKSKFKTIFNPGYTSKKRGWGLGLSLADRIIENYHKGKIFVKSSALKKGTTIRIVLKKY
ncbi:MAG: HAMP domain-containing histidine kinase [Bacteroidales bacterium]|nr:HAMP domain-containing histidine kinase [Bacteroidales bacterium]